MNLMCIVMPEADNLTPLFGDVLLGPFMLFAEVKSMIGCTVEVVRTIHADGKRRCIPFCWSTPLVLVS